MPSFPWSFADRLRCALLTVGCDVTPIEVRSGTGLRIDRRRGAIHRHPDRRAICHPGWQPQRVLGRQSRLGFAARYRLCSGPSSVAMTRSKCLFPRTVGPPRRRYGAHCSHCHRRRTRTVVRCRRGERAACRGRRRSRRVSTACGEDPPLLTGIVRAASWILGGTTARLATCEIR